MMLLSKLYETATPYYATSYQGPKIVASQSEYNLI